MAIIKISDNNMDKITKYNLIRGNGAGGLKGVEGQEIFYMKEKNKLNSVYGMSVQNPAKPMMK